MSNPLKISVLCVFSIIVQMILGDDFRNDSLFLWRATDFKLSEWRGRTEFDYIKNIDKWDFGCISLPTNRLNLTVSDSGGYDKKHRMMLLFSVGQDSEFRIDVHLLSDVNQAHDQIVRVFAEMAAAKLRFVAYPDIGDRGYYDDYTVCPMIIFARNNVVVSVESRIDELNVLEIARQIDREILKQSGVKTGQSPKAASDSKKTVKPNERERKDNGKDN